MRSHARVSVVFIAMFALFAIVASSASAEYLYRGPIATAPAVDSPRRVAVEQSTGNVFVVEDEAVDDGETRDRVLVFKPEGVSAVPLAEFGLGVLDAPYGIAIDESGGQTAIYVSDAGNNRIVRFLSDGQASPGFTIDGTYASPTQGSEASQIQNFASPLALAPDDDLWVADRGANVIKRFDATGTHVGGSNFDGSTSPKGAFTGLLDLAANSEGDLYVVDTSGDIGKSEGTSRVERFAESGAFKATIGPLGPVERSAIVAVHPGDDSVAVSGDQDRLAQGLPNVIYRFDSANAPIDQFELSNDYIQGGTYRGMAFHSSLRNPLYLSFGRTFLGGSEGAGSPSVHAASEAIPPTVAMDPVSTVSGDAATITGEVDPNGLEASWKIEYSRIGTFSWTVTGTRSAGSGMDPVPVSEELEGLLPGAEYEVRLQASTADGAVETAPATFTTDTVAPRVISQSAVAGVDAATLGARINPGGEETTYRFEYGPTSAYGQSSATATIPAGTEGVNVSAPITGLTPGATYHFRVVAESATGEDSGPDEAFTTLSGEADTCPNAQYRTGSEARLGECRAYELVTPRGAQADLRIGGGPATADGRTVCFNTEYPMLDSDPNGIKLGDDGFCASRDADGWETKWVTGPAALNRVGYHGSNVYYLSADGQRAVFASDLQIFSPDYEGKGGGASPTMRSYLWEGGQTRELTPPAPPFLGTFYLPEAETTARRPLGVSDDLRRGVFQSSLAILPEDMNFSADVYEWHPGGLRIVSTSESGVPAGGTVSRGDGDPGGVRPYSGAPGTMSADGSRIFFQHEGIPLDDDAESAEAPEGAMSVYMREGDEVTLISPRRGTGPDQNVEFMAASADGEIAYLQTSQQLTPEAKESGPAIYRYDLASEELELVADRPSGVHFLGASEDGSTIVYSTLSSQQVYVLRDGTAHLLGTLGGTDTFMHARIGTTQPDRRGLRITPDGSVVVFAAAGEFAGATGGVAQIFRWAEGEGVESISAAGPSLPTQDASIGAYPTIFPGSAREEFLHNHREKAMDGRVISDDGSRVFFETPEALVERDVNGVVDVYEWHDGDVELVSSGTGSKALYHNSSADGKTVFLTTFERLEPEFDTNDNRDLYVAQPGGGFPPPPAPSDCAGEACQSQRSAPSPSTSGLPGGEGNALPAPKISALTKKQLKQLASKGWTVVRIEVAAPGRLVAVLEARLGKRKATVAKATRSVEKAGVAGLRLKLSKPAREALRERGRLRLGLEVRHSELEQPARKVVMLRD